MPTIKVNKVVDASINAVWASWDDFGNIDKFNPNLNASHLLSESPTGQGAQRRRRQ